MQLKHVKGDDNIVADAFSRMEIHNVSKKELQQREALKMLNTMRMPNIKTVNMQLNPSLNKRSDVNNAIINHVFQNSVNDVQTRKNVRQNLPTVMKPANLNKNLHTCLVFSPFQ